MGLTNPSLACRRAVAMAWSGAYRQFATSAEPIDVWLTRTTISSNRHPRLLDEWIALDYDLHVIDPGFSVEWERARGRRDPPSCQAMVRAALTQALVDTRRAERRARLVALGLRSEPVQIASRPKW